MRPRPAKPRRVVTKVMTRAHPVVRPVFIATNTMFIQAPMTYALHQHLSHELIFVGEGRYTCRVNHVPLEIRRNQLLVVAPGDWHEDFFIPPLALHGLHFSLEVPALAARAQLFRPGITAPEQVIDCSRELRASMLELLREVEVGDSIDAGLQDALVGVFFWKLMRALPKSALSPHWFDVPQEVAFLARLRQIFRKHQDGALAIADMADALGISPSSLSAKCRRYLGRSPQQAFTASKIERAEALLAQTDMSIQEVSDYLGFGDPFHFSKVFKRCAGVAPSHRRRTSR
jgi:AraC-like DNA-binding protein